MGPSAGGAPGEDDPESPDGPADREEGDGDGHRAGFCALVGLPNVGKSTLLNRLVGERLAAVTPKPQTTRRRLRGIWSGAEGQVVFVDTPGRLDPRYPLQEAMLAEAERAAADADALVHVVDAGYGPSVEAAAGGPSPSGPPALLCLNKVDRVEADERERIADELAAAGWSPVIPTVAREGRGIEALREAALRLLPASPPLYPRDQLATDPVRTFVASFVREACFRQLSEEVPYSVAVQVEQFREDEDPLYVSASVYVERDSQKGIVIGEGGRRIRAIGTAARERIEAFLDRRVYLDLRVKVLHKWRKRRGPLSRLGYRLPDEGGER